MVMPPSENPVNVFINPHGDIVIRQQGSAGDQVVIVSPDAATELVVAIEEARRAAQVPD